MAYPVSVSVIPPSSPRNRLTAAFRAILAIPHIILVGGVGATFAFSDDDQRRSSGAEGGLLGVVAFFVAVVSWFTIVFGGVHFDGLRRFTAFYLRWRARAIAYLLLLEDAYPPFGDGPYPVALEVAPPASRRRLSVALRAFLIVPLFFVLIAVMIGWCAVTIIAWFSILFTGRHPQRAYDFSVRALRWRMQLDAYVLLLVDEYPPWWPE